MALPKVKPKTKPRGGARKRVKSAYEEFVEDYGSGPQGYARSFLEDLTGVDFKKSDPSKSRAKFENKYGKGIGGYARSFLTSLTGADFSVDRYTSSMGTAGDAISATTTSRSGMNMGRPAPQVQVTPNTAKKYNNPTLATISNQVADIVQSLAAVNQQLKAQLDVTRFGYNEALKVERENILEAGANVSPAGVPASNDNSPISNMGTSALVAAMTAAVDQLTDLSEQLKGLDLQTIAKCCGNDIDIPMYGGGDSRRQLPGDVDTRDPSKRRPSGSTRGGMFRKLRVQAKMLRRTATRAAMAGAGAFGTGAGRFVGRGIAGATIGLGADFLADYLGRATRGGALAATVGKTATYAGIGSMIGGGLGGLIGLLGGPAGVLAGAAVGAKAGAYVGGLYGASQGIMENWDALTAPLTGAGSTGDAKQAMKFFIDRGWAPHQAAGIVGNLQAESGPNLNPNAKRENDAGPGQHSMGIAQWNRNRLANLLAFAQSRGKPWNDFQTQLEFVDHELKGDESAAGNALARTRTAEEAAVVVDDRYERSDKSARGKRIANAKTLFEDHSKQATPTQKAGVTPTAANGQAPLAPMPMYDFSTGAGATNPQTGAPLPVLKPEVMKSMEQNKPASKGTGWGGAPYAPGKGPQDVGLPQTNYQKMRDFQSSAKPGPAPTPTPDAAIADKPDAPPAILKGVDGKPGVAIATKSVQNAMAADEPEVMIMPSEDTRQIPMMNGSTLPSSMVGTDGVPDPTFPELLMDSSTRRAFYYYDYTYARGR